MYICKFADIKKKADLCDAILTEYEEKCETIVTTIHDILIKSMEMPDGVVSFMRLNEGKIEKVLLPRDSMKFNEDYSCDFGIAFLLQDGKYTIPLEFKIINADRVYFNGECYDPKLNLLRICKVVEEILLKYFYDKERTLKLCAINLYS